MDGNKNKKGQLSKILVCTGQYLYHKNRDYIREGGDLVTVEAILSKVEMLSLNYCSSGADATILPVNLVPLRCQEVVIF